jgi:uroporphyrinogen decarboxylase
VLNETAPSQPGYPRVKELYEIFGAENVFHNESYYLKQSMFSTDDLARTLDRVDTLLDGNLREFLLPPEWDAEKKRLLALGVGSPWYRYQRGPVTFAASIYGAENLIYLILDEPDLAGRFRDTILRAMLERAHVFDVEAEWKPDPEGNGWFGFADDNCCLLTKEMYDFFAKPILKACFDKYAPGPKASRFQHSDSDMAQHLETLGELGLTGCNFGPNLTVAQIREKIPGARIDGQIAPYTLMRNEEVNLVAEVIRDCEMARKKRGLNVATAGSINNGSRLTGLRLVMAAIQRYGRY